jgi:SAM-dependent methyltransferase
MVRSARLNVLLGNLKVSLGRIIRARGLSRPAGTDQIGEHSVMKDDIRKILEPSTQTDIWNEEATGFRRRLYHSYEDYLEHQIAKLAQIDLSTYHVEFRNRLRQRIQVLEIAKRGDTVLCLGARLGTECLAFKDLGCFAVGIDLNPGAQNLHVVHGDFHRIQFPDGSVDHVFTNALDHAFDLNQVILEVKRILNPKGTFIAEIVRGSLDSEGREPGAFESYWWDSLERVIGIIESHGFVVEQRHRFSYPWQGDQIVFRFRVQANWQK